jgi:hypothetical protein
MDSKGSECQRDVANDIHYTDYYFVSCQTQCNDLVARFLHDEKTHQNRVKFENLLMDQDTPPHRNYCIMKLSATYSLWSVLIVAELYKVNQMVLFLNLFDFLLRNQGRKGDSIHKHEVCGWPYCSHTNIDY